MGHQISIRDIDRAVMESFRVITRVEIEILIIQIGEKKSIPKMINMKLYHRRKAMI